MSDYAARYDAPPEVNWTQPHDLLAKNMTLRDYFAAQAMAGDWAVQGNCDALGIFNHGASLESLGTMAALYYRMADAMLKAREP